MAGTNYVPEPIPVHVATAEQYRQALLAARPHLTNNMLAMLKFQFRAPSHTVTATELVKSIGYATYHPANRQYGELGKILAEELRFTPPRRADETFRYWTTLSLGDNELEEGEHWRFVMRPELASTLAGLRWV